MKLAMPSLAVWLLGFYAFFHCGMNVLAEVLRFADRGFFLDWWNSTRLDSFWRKWNLPGARSYAQAAVATPAPKLPLVGDPS